MQGNNYQIRYEEISGHIKEFSEKAVNYIFITDIHYGSGSDDKIKASIMSQMETIACLAESNDKIDLIVIGGDTTTGMYSQKEKALEDLGEVFVPLKKCKKPVLILIGNHDDNSYHLYCDQEHICKQELVLSDKDWQKYIIEEYCPHTVVKDSLNPDSKYYYYDIPQKQVRIICLDGIAYEHTYDSDGTISYMFEGGGTAYWGYSALQLKWLITQAFTAQDGWDYIIFSHMGIDFDTNCYRYRPHFGVELRGILAAFQNKTAFAHPAIGEIDFSNATGKIRCYQFGHNHCELTLYSDDIKLWQIATATPNIYQSSRDGELSRNISNKELDWKNYIRNFDTSNEFSFDIVSCEGERIQKYAFGAGKDEIMVYSK